MLRLFPHICKKKKKSLEFFSPEDPGARSLLEGLGGPENPKKIKSDPELVCFLVNKQKSKLALEKKAFNLICISD